MKKLDVGVGYSVLKEGFVPMYEPRVWDKVIQHRIILSKNIIAYYKKNFQQDSIPQYLFNDFLKSKACLSQYFAFFEDHSDCIDVRQEIINFVENTPKKVLISKRDEFNDLDICEIDFTTPQDIINDDTDKSFVRYTLPVTIGVKVNTLCDQYISTLADYFIGENQISIVDPYLMNECDLEITLESLLGIFPQKAEVNIYCAEEKTLTKKGKDFRLAANRIVNSYSNDNLKIYVNYCYSKDMHDRYIHLSNCEIIIPKGCDIFRKGELVNKPTSITVIKEKQYPIPYTVEQKQSLIHCEVKMYVLKINDTGDAIGHIDNVNKAKIPRRFITSDLVQQELLVYIDSYYVKENIYIVHPV